MLGDRRAERQLRIRAHSAPGQVAGAASYTSGLSAHKKHRPARPAFSQSPRPGTTATLTRDADRTDPALKRILIPVHHCHERSAPARRAARPTRIRAAARGTTSVTTPPAKWCLSTAGALLAT